MSEMSTTAMGASAAAPDFSLIGLFLGADFVVQVVILLLIGASFWCWTIVFSKSMTLRRYTSEGEKFEALLTSGKSLDSIYDHTATPAQDQLSSVFATAMQEWRRMGQKIGTNSPERHSRVLKNIERVMRQTANRELDLLEQHLGFLATVGATAPFIGLFGTVWGIMNSFQGIALMKSTNLAVVAPGISEALLATALGLIAAIPAVIAYNKLSNDLDRYAGRLDEFVQEVGSIFSNHLEEA